MVSIGHSEYKQQSSVSDYSLFVTAIVPLKITTCYKEIIWINNKPQSVRFCRPLEKFKEFSTKVFESYQHQYS